MSSKGVAIVTGGAQGIGRGIALRLAADGFDIALGDLSSSKAAVEAVAQEIRGLGRKAVALAVDVSVESEVKSLVAQTVAELGGLDVMVANAGIAGGFKPLVDLTTDDFDRVISVNVRGVMLCYKYAAIQLIEQGRGGRIIGASSMMGKKGGVDGSAYCASKFAVRGLTQSAALELGKHGITVNAYAPGTIHTAMLELVDEQATSASGRPKGDQMKVLAKMSAVGYNGTPAEISSLVSYLASKEAHFITGQSIGVDGGIVFD